MIGNGDIRGKLNVVEAIDSAIRRTRYILFEPLLYTKWLNFGVMLFLSVLFSGGSGFGANIGSSLSSPFRGSNLEDAYFTAEAFVVENIVAILLVVLPILALSFILGAALMYVRARGTMMVIRAIAYDDDGIGENWQKVGTPTWSYFIFQLELAIAFTVYIIVVGFVGALLIRQKMLEEVSTRGLTSGLAMIALVSLVVWIGFALAAFVMHNFIAPLMFHFDATCGEAWGEFFKIARGNPGSIAFYFIIKVVYSFVFGTVRTFAVCCTCFLGGLPVIGQTLLAPLYIFERAYSLYMIGSLGPEYVIVREPLPPEPPMLPRPVDALPPPNINR